MGRPRTLAGFKTWIKIGKKLRYAGAHCIVTSVRSRSFQLTDSNGDDHQIPMCIGNNTFKGKEICLNKHELQWTD